LWRFLGWISSSCSDFGLETGQLDEFCLNMMLVHFRVNNIPLMNRNTNFSATISFRKRHTNFPL
jgi:hypothetical protein